MVPKLARICPNTDPRSCWKIAHHIQPAPSQAAKAAEEDGEASLVAINGFHSYKCKHGLHHTLFLGEKRERKYLDSSRAGGDFVQERWWGCKEAGMSAGPADNNSKCVPDPGVCWTSCMSPSEPEHRRPSRLGIGAVWATDATWAAALLHLWYSLHGVIFGVIQPGK